MQPARRSIRGHNANSQSGRLREQRTLSLERLQARELMAADLEASFPKLMPSLFDQLAAPTAAVARSAAPASSFDRVSSWAGVPPTVVSFSSYVPVTLNSSGDASGSATISSNETDYYGFIAPTSGTYRFAVSTPTSNVDSVLGVFNSAGQRVAYNDDISSSNTDSQVSVSLTAGQRYYFGVTNYTGTPNGAYSWLVDGPANSPAPGPAPGPAPTTDDAYEDNDTINTATNLGTVTSAGTLSGLKMQDSADWFRFTINANGTSSSSVSIAFTHSQGDIDMTLHNASGTQVASSAGSGNSESISLNGLAAGTYYVRIYGYNGARNANYSLTITPPASAPAPGPGPAPTTDDAYEDNDTISTATNLGAITSAGTLSNLKMADSADWFRFTINSAGTSGSSVGIAFTHSQGDLDMTLHNASGTQVGSSGGSGNSEAISLNGLAAGTYYVRVYGYNGARNGNYSLSITPPSSTPAPGPGPAPGTGARRLYLNFDGVNLSRTDLNRYDSGEWMTGLLDSLDSDRNGISVQPVYSGRSDRTQIINQIVSMVQADLSRFGITVVRSTGAAVENQYATTIFIGRSTLTGGATHVAVDIDRGNRNRTDIAFVGEESWGSASNTAIAMADTVLHEAGHTFGLHHVTSGTALESMGLRYNNPSSYWIQDTSFMNQSFGPYHQGDSNQNSFQVMAATFGTTSNPTASQPMTIAWQGTASRPGVDCSLDHVQSLLSDFDHHELEGEDHDHDHDDHHADEEPASSLLGGGATVLGTTAEPRRSVIGPQPLNTPAVTRTLLDLVHQRELEESELRRSTTRTTGATAKELDEALAAWDQIALS